MPLDPFKVAHWMNARKYTVAQIADLAGVPRDTVAAMLSETDEVAPEVTAAVAAVLQIDESQLRRSAVRDLTAICQPPEALRATRRPIERDGTHFYNYYTMMRVVYTDPAWALDDYGALRLDKADLEREILGPDIAVDLAPVQNGAFVTGQELYDFVGGVSGAVVYRCAVTPDLLSALLPTCRVVARSGVGIDNLNAPLLVQAGVYGFHVPDYCGAEVSTHTLALLLALERGICVQDRLIRADQWAIHRGGVPPRTASRSVGIVGFGRIGRATARKLQPFYRRIFAVDPYVPSDLMASYGIERCTDLADLFASVDAVVLHTSLTPETDCLIDASVLAHARPGCLLVNSARGQLVDTSAVLDALESGRLGGFASDVFAPEDPNASPVARKLLQRDDVVVSAHRAFLSTESELSLRRRVAQGVRAVLSQSVPPPEGRVA